MSNVARTCGCHHDVEQVDAMPRRLLKRAVAAGAPSAVIAGVATASNPATQAEHANPETPGLPQMDMEIDLVR